MEINGDGLIHKRYGTQIKNLNIPKHFYQHGNSIMF